jgi:hypothetical protein
MHLVATDRLKTACTSLHCHLAPSSPHRVPFPPVNPMAQVGGAVERLGAAAERRRLLWAAEGPGLLHQDLPIGGLARWPVGFGGALSQSIPKPLPTTGRRALQDQPGGFQGQVQGRDQHSCLTPLPPSRLDRHSGCWFTHPRHPPTPQPTHPPTPTPQLNFWVYVGVTGWEGTSAKVPDIYARIGGAKGACGLVRIHDSRPDAFEPMCQYCSGERQVGRGGLGGGLVGAWG